MSTYIHPLGRIQLSILRTLRERKYYRHGGGWQWGSHTKTERVLDSLVRRGLVEVTVETITHSWHSSKPYDAKTWRLTPAGEAVLEEQS